MRAIGHPSSMTWMPDRTAAPSGRRLSRTSQNPAQNPSQSHSPGHSPGPHQPERPQHEPHHPQGIPRILGRRARWFGARLRREA